MFCDLPTNITQIQLQMYACQTDKCDFMVWAKTSSIICRVWRDERFIQETVNILTDSEPLGTP